MALQKTITLPHGGSGNYIRIGAIEWDDIKKSAHAHFRLYTSEAYRDSAPDSPLTPVIAKLWLDGEKFDEWLSPAVLDALVSPGIDPMRDQLYAAAKVEVLQAGGGLTSIDFSDATDV